MGPNEKARQGDDLAGLESNILPLNHTPFRTSAALTVLRDAVTATGVDAYTGEVVLAAADSYAKVRVRDKFAAFLCEVNGGPSGVSS